MQKETDSQPFLIKLQQIQMVFVPVCVNVVTFVKLCVCVQLNFNNTIMQHYKTMEKMV